MVVATGISDDVIAVAMEAARARNHLSVSLMSGKMVQLFVPGAEAAKMAARNELVAAEHGLVRAVLRAAHARAPLAYQTHTPHRPQTLFQPPPALWQVLSL